MSGAAADAEQKQAAAALAQIGERSGEMLDALVIYRARDLARLIEERLDVTHATDPTFTPMTGCLVISLPYGVKAQQVRMSQPAAGLQAPCRAGPSPATAGAVCPVAVAPERRSAGAPGSAISSKVRKI